MNNKSGLLKNESGIESAFEDLSLLEMMKNINDRFEIIERTNNENMQWFLTADNSVHYLREKSNKARQCETPIKQREVIRVY